MKQNQSRSSKMETGQNSPVGGRDARDTYKYHLKDGNKVIHRGVTNNLERREIEHQKTSPGSHIVQVGRRTTRTAALKWEKEAGSPSGWDVRKATKRAIGMNRDALKELGRL